MAQQTSSLKSVSIVSVCAFVQLLIQLAIQLVLAKNFGASAEMEAYNAGMLLPTLISTAFVGPLAYAFVPAYIGQRTLGNERPAQDLANTLGLLLLGCTLSLVLLGYVGTKEIVVRLWPGFSTVEAEKTAELLRILAWLLVANSLITFLQALHHCHQQFLVPASAGLLGVTLTLLSTWTFCETGGIRAAALSIVAGAALSAVIQLPLLLRHFRPQLRFDEPLRRCLTALLPLVLGAAYYNLGPVIDQYLASQMDEGSISHLGYAWRLTQPLIALSVGGISIVVFPVLASHSAGDRTTEFRNEMAYAMRFVCVTIVPLLVGSCVCGRLLIRNVVEGGKFTSTDTAQVARLFVLYGGVVLGAGFGEILSKVLFARNDTRSPVLIGIVCFTIAAGLKLVWAPRYGVAGLAVVTSLYYLSTAGCMLFLICRRLGAGAFAGVPGALVRSVICAAVASAAGYSILEPGGIVASIVAPLSGMGLYYGMMLLMHDEFAVRLWDVLAQRFRPRPGV